MACGAVRREAAAVLRAARRDRVDGVDDERRVVAADGRSRAFINGQPVTLQDSRALGSLLVAAGGDRGPLLNLYLHSGHELALVEALLAPLGINTSGFHNAHHELMWTNYGELLYVWDIILDTGFHPGKFRLPCGRKTLSRY